MNQESYPQDTYASGHDGSNQQYFQNAQAPEGYVLMAEQSYGQQPLSQPSDNYYMSQGVDQITDSRVKNINDEILKQRQYLPQFQGVQQVGYQTQTSGFVQGKKGRKILSSNKSSAYGPQTTTQSRDHGERETATNNFRNNLELLQQQQRMQSNMLDQRNFLDTSQVHGKKKKSQGGSKEPSSIGILRGSKQFRPDIERFSHDQEIREQTHNFGYGSRADTNSRLQSSKLRTGWDERQGPQRLRSNHRRNIRNTSNYYDRVANDMKKQLKTQQWGISTAEEHFFNQTQQPDNSFIQQKSPNMNKTINGSRLSAFKKHKTPQKLSSNHNYQKDYAMNRRKMVQTEQRIGYENNDQRIIQNKKSNQNMTPIRMKDYEKQMSQEKIINKTQGRIRVVPTGYVNYVNGVPIEEMPQVKEFNSPQPKNNRKRLQGRNDHLPQIKQSAAPITFFNTDQTMFDEDPNSKSKKTFGKRERVPVKERGDRDRPSDQFFQDQREKRERSLEAKPSPKEKLPGVQFQPETSFNQQKKMGPSQLSNSKSQVAKGGPASPEKYKKVTQSKSQGKHIRFDPNQDVIQSDLTQINIITSNGQMRGQEMKNRHKSGHADSEVSRKKSDTSSRGKQIRDNKDLGSSALTPNKSQNKRLHQTPKSQRNYSKQEEVLLKSARSRNDTNLKLPSARSGKSDKQSERAKFNQKSFRSRHSYTSEYKGHGPLPQKKKMKRVPNTILRFDERYFKKIPGEPNLAEVDVDLEDFTHLMNDDMDGVSRMEVVYKILKEQLRTYQKALIEVKENKRKEKKEKMLARSKPRNGGLSKTDLKTFAKYIKHYELHGAENRDLSPELKRIVEKLSCQEHKFMYCPCCKTYDEEDFDPVENIQKFMAYIREEQDKLRRKRNRRQYQKNKKQPNQKLADDSVSEITDLEQEEILYKYYEETLTKAEKHNRDRKKVQARLYGESNAHRHICSTTHRCQSAEPRKTVKMELREVQEGVSMHDESVSAHQFSMRDVSVQDSDFKKEIAMQTSAIDYKSQNDQYVKQGAEIQTQTAALEFDDQNVHCDRDRENQVSMGVQTDKKLIKLNQPKKVSVKQQTERKPLDIYREDWIESIVFRKAVRNEAMKRSLPYEEVKTIEDDDISEDETSVDGDHFVNPADLREAQHASGLESDAVGNSQDPDQGVIDNGLGLVHNIHQRGRQMLTESEIMFIKSLLKVKNHNVQIDQKYINAIHKNTRFTIRKLTYQMANIDNYKIMKRLREPTTDHTLYLVYRADRLYSALADAEKIFKLFSITLFDAPKFQEIVDTKSIRKEDQIFIKKREQYFRRIMSQVNNFLDSYKLFGGDFLFKAQNIKELIMKEIESITEAKIKMEEIKKKNPELAAKEDLRVIQEQRSSVKTVAPKSKGGLRQAGDNQLSPSVAKIMLTDDDPNMQSPSKTIKMPKISRDNQDNILEEAHELSPLNVNKHHDQDYVGKRTLEVINKQADQQSNQQMLGGNSVQDFNSLAFTKQNLNQKSQVPINYQVSKSSITKAANQDGISLPVIEGGGSNYVTQMTGSKNPSGNHLNKDLSELESSLTKKGITQRDQALNFDSVEKDGSINTNPMDDKKAMGKSALPTKVNII